MADVQCENCRGVFHETTARFRRGVPAKGYMLRLKEPYRSYGWDSFPETEDFGYASLECPGCGVPYAAGSGMLTLIELPVQPSEIFQLAHKGPVEEQPVFRAKEHKKPGRPKRV